MNYDSPSEIIKVLEKHSLALKKRFGQNFLINSHARERIVSLLEAAPGELVWEVGPGLGAMTGLLLERAGPLVAFEIDHGLVRALRELYPDRPALVIVEGDALETMAAAVASHGRPARLIGNLPYASASRIVSYLAEEEPVEKKIVVTVQKDMALRMRAAPGDKIYSSFSVFTQSYFDVQIEFDLKGGNFFPRPEVDSSVVSLVPSGKLVPGAVREMFQKLIRLAFGSRRKTLNNNLLKSEWLSVEEKAKLREIWTSLGVKESSRAEELPPETYRDMAMGLAGLRKV